MTLDPLPQILILLAAAVVVVTIARRLGLPAILGYLAVGMALGTHAVGIFVAIPAVIGFNVAQKRAGELENSVMSQARLLSAWIQLEDGRREEARA